MSFLFGSSGQNPEAFRAPGYEQQGALLNQLFQSNLFGSSPQLSAGLDSQIGSLQQQIAALQSQGAGGTNGVTYGATGYGPGGSITYGNTGNTSNSKELAALNSQLAQLQSMQGMASSGGTQYPSLSFDQRNPYQFSDINYDPATAVGDAFTPLSDNLQNQYSKMLTDSLQATDEEVNKRGLYQSGAGLEASRNVRRDSGDQLSNALAQLAGQQANAYTQAGQFAEQLKQQREMNQAAEIFRNQGATDQNALQMAQWAMQLQRIPIEDLMRFYQLSTGATPGSPGSPGLVQSLAPAAGQIASTAILMCLPKGTKIEGENDSFAFVEDVKIGDKLKGGVVIARFQKLRSSDHKFSKHTFKNGEVVMTYGHPYFDDLISVEEVSHDSECTYDILTDSGHYFVNGVKLGSTIK